jgi:hypothetical protein
VGGPTTRGWDVRGCGAERVPAVAVVVALVVVVLVIAAACSRRAAEEPAVPTPPSAEAGTSMPAAAPGSAGPGATPPSAEAGVELAALPIDDGASAPIPYRRDDWRTWVDVDGDGCDAREQALREQSSSPAQVDPVGCTIIAGDWTSVYDGFRTDDPAELDIDHVVSLENAHRSGGWAWTADRRVQFANDQRNLLAVSARSNRSKGSDPPNEWRPPNQESWCQMATIWVRVKLAYGLTATSGERDALGQMLETC